MKYTYPSTSFEDDSNSILLDTGKTGPHNNLNINTATIEDLSNLIVAEMISSVKEDLRAITSNECPKKVRK
ncbi:hypothetical protein [Marivirga lumbricoides]